MSRIRTVRDQAARRVKVLPDPVARKIAAGEVIDRPYAAVRELLDNALDAGAREISVTLSGGGIDEVRVTDDGCGMEKEDLELCWLPHATSKISTVEDLESAGTLGFRGEALASLAACSRLEIVSSRNGEATGIEIHGGKRVFYGPKAGAPGTAVSVRDLFFNLPARRRFLKSSRAESGLCRSVFLEKAAAHPDVSFRLFSDGVLKLYLPPGSPADRIRAAWPSAAPPGAWWETHGEGNGFEYTAVHARPEMNRRDRKYIQIYANGRRIDEFALVQAVQYAYDAWMPGGVFPLAFVFLEINPTLVDFNIHPAKKEARFRDITAVRHRLIESLKDRMTRESYRDRAGTPAGRSVQSELGTVDGEVQAGGAAYDGTYSAGAADAAADGGGIREARSLGLRWTDGPIIHKKNTGSAGVFGDTVSALRNQRTDENGSTAPEGRGEGTEGSIRYLGQAMGVFLVAECAGSLFIVDQHAAHERILYEEYLKSPPAAEPLLIPRPLELDESAAMKLELRRERLEGLGMEFETDAKGRMILVSLPQAARGLEDEIADFLESGAGDAEGLEKDLWADLSCKAAVKDNSVLDERAARILLEKAFALETPRCPHGRPIWFEVSRKELFELVGRTV